MLSPDIKTIVKIMENLPESTQQRVVEHLYEYLADIQDDTQWNETFQKTQAQLAAAARRAKQEIAAGKAKPLQLDEL